jgi:hypothetical protein
LIELERGSASDVLRYVCSGYACHDEIEMRRKTSSSGFVLGSNVVRDGGTVVTLYRWKIWQPRGRFGGLNVLVLFRAISCSRSLRRYSFLGVASRTMWFHDSRLWRGWQREMTKRVSLTGTFLQGVAGQLVGVNLNTRAQNTNTRIGTKSLRNPSGRRTVDCPRGL